jgi:uncharacterized protein
MEYAGSAFEIKQLDDAGRIEGLAAAFGNVDHGGDKMLAGSVTKTLAQRGDRPLPMLLHHDLQRGRNGTTPPKVFTSKAP